MSDDSHMAHVTYREAGSLEDHLRRLDGQAELLSRIRGTRSVQLSALFSPLEEPADYDDILVNGGISGTVHRP